MDPVAKPELPSGAMDLETKEPGFPPTGVGSQSGASVDLAPRSSGHSYGGSGRKADPPLSRQIASDIRIWLVSVLCAIAVFGIAIFMQWLIYDDWLHDKGPLRIVGSLLAGGLTFAVAVRWQFAIRWRKVEMLRRFEFIKWMNDRIRNSLQAIECVTYAADPQATESVRSAVDAIEEVLHEVLAESHPEPPANVPRTRAEETSMEVSE